MKKIKFLAVAAIVLVAFGCKKEEPVVKVNSVTLNETEITLEEDKTFQLIATVEPAKSPQDVVWESSKPEIATVQKGLVIAKNVGTTIITATAGEYVATCKVIVQFAAGTPKTINNIACTYIPSGTFMMGSPDSDADASDYEKPQHKVTLTKGYYMGKYEITNAQFAEFLNAKSVDASGSGVDNILLVYAYSCGVQYNSVANKWEPANGYENHPIVYVTWNGANEYAQWAGGALPTEAQWEYACRAGSTTRWCFGDDESQLGNYAWYLDNSDDKPKPVGQKKPNAWGLYDMHGNVFEWCADWCDDYSKDAQTDPTGPSSGSHNIIRGGSVKCSADVCSSSYRRGERGFNESYDSFISMFGFRVVFAAE